MVSAADRVTTAVVARLALLCGLNAAAGMAVSAYGPALPDLAQVLGSNLAALGAVFTAFSLGIIAAQFVVGPLGDRLDLRWLLAAGALLLALGSTGLASALLLSLVYTGALVAGLGFGTLLTSLNLAVVRLLPSRAASVVNLLNASFGIGSVTSLLLVGQSARVLGSVLPVLWVGVALLLLLLALVPTLPRSVPTASAYAVRPDGGPLGLLREPMAWLLGSLLFLYLGTEISVAGWSVRYLELSTGLTTANAALVTAGFWFTLTVGRLLGAVLALRLAVLALLRLCLLGALLSAVGVLLAYGSVVGSVAAIMALGLCFGPVFPAVLMLTANAFPERSGAATGFVMMLGNASNLCMPWLTGYALTTSGAGITSIALVVNAGLLLALALSTGRASAAATRPARL